MMFGQAELEEMTLAVKVAKEMPLTHEEEGRVAKSGMLQSMRGRVSEPKRGDVAGADARLAELFKTIHYSVYTTTRRVGELTLEDVYLLCLNVESTGTRLYCTHRTCAWFARTRSDYIPKIFEDALFLLKVNEGDLLHDSYADGFLTVATSIFRYTEDTLFYDYALKFLRCVESPDARKDFTVQLAMDLAIAMKYKGLSWMQLQDEIYQDLKDL
jgi:hypothetical protein